MKLSKSQCNKLCTRRRFFSQRVIDVWNSLSEFMVPAPSTNIFKNRVDNNWRMIWATYKRLTSSLANAHYLYMCKCKCKPSWKFNSIQFKIVYFQHNTYIVHTTMFLAYNVLKRERAEDSAYVGSFPNIII